MDPFARTMWRFGFGFAAGILVAFIAVSAVYFHARPRCSDRGVASSGSPGRQWTASVMERRCGEEESFYTHVNVRATARPEHYGYFSGLLTEGEVFRVEQDALTAGVVLQWTADDQLTIRCPRCTRSTIRQRDGHLHEDSGGEISITYELPDR